MYLERHRQHKSLYCCVVLPLPLRLASFRVQALTSLPPCWNLLSCALYISCTNYRFQLAAGRGMRTSRCSLRCQARPERLKRPIVLCAAPGSHVAPAASRTSSQQAATSPARAGPGHASGTLRRLVLLRHADSDQTTAGVRDHDRPISAHGRAQAASVAKQLKELGWTPDLVLASNSKRTKQTLDEMAEVLQVRGFVGVAGGWLPAGAAPVGDSWWGSGVRASQPELRVAGFSNCLLDGGKPTGWHIGPGLSTE